MCFLVDLVFLSSDPAHCFVDFLLSVHILKPGTLNWAPHFNAEGLVVLGGLFSLCFEELFARLHCSIVTLLYVTHVRLCEQSQRLRFCVSLHLVACLDSLLISVREVCSSFSQIEELKAGWEPAWKTIDSSEKNQYLPAIKNSFPYVVNKM